MRIVIDQPEFEADVAILAFDMLSAAFQSVCATLLRAEPESARTLLRGLEREVEAVAHKAQVAYPRLAESSIASAAVDRVRAVLIATEQRRSEAG